MQANPNIYDVSYVRCNPSRYGASRLVRYLTRRPEEKTRPGPESRWHTLPDEQVFGDAERFKEAANRRRRERVESARRRGVDMDKDHSPKNVSYLHIVVSPSRREDFEDEDFGALIDPWIRDKRGKPCPYFATVHRDDPEGPKIHIAVARDRLHKTKELPRLKELTRGIINERETLHDLERYPEHAQERDPQPDHEARREATMQDRQREEEAREQQAEQETQRKEEAQREEEAREEEERQIEERRREREEREARERDEDEHNREM